MAQAVRRTIRRPIPEGATIITKRGKTYAEWPGRGGKTRCEPVVETSDGPRLDIGSDVWWAQWRNEHGKIQMRKGFSDKEATYALARKLADQARSRKLGLTDAADEHRAAQGRRKIEHHVADYRAALEAKGSSARHIKQTIGYIDAVRDILEWVSIRSIRADSLVAHLAQCKKDEGFGPRTYNAKLIAWRGFTR